jgi:4-amino-4-deoxy-L-arabinose transferase-like glycosyltransferase
MGKIIPPKLFWILLLAFVTRVFLLSSVPPALNWDEVSMGYSAYSIMETGMDEWGDSLPLFFRSYGEWKSPVYIYLLVPFIKLFGLNAWGVRLPAALAGIGVIYLTYLLAKHLYNEKVGLIAAFLLTISPWHLMLSRPGFEAGVSLLFFLLGIYLYLLSLDSSRWKHLMGSALFFGLAPYTYNSAKLLVPLIVGVLLTYSYKKVKPRKIFIFLLTLALMATPMIIDFATGNGRARYGQVGITTDAEAVTEFYHYRDTFPLPDTLNKVVFNKYTFMVTKSFSNWTSYLSPHFLLGSSSIRPQHSLPYRGVIYLFEFFLLIVGLTQLGKYRGLARTLPIALIVFGFVPAALTKDPYHVLRSILTLPAWQILAALGLTHLIKIKFKYLNLLYALAAIEVFSFFFLYYAWYPRAFARDWQVGYSQAVEYVDAHQDSYDQIIFTKAYGEPHVFVAFYSQLDPRIFQEDSKKLLDYQLLGLPWVDQLEEYSIGKYTFKQMEWDGGSDGSRTLYVGKGDDFWADTPILDKIDFPNGTNAFTITSGR